MIDWSRALLLTTDSLSPIAGLDTTTAQGILVCNLASDFGLSGVFPRVLRLSARRKTSQS